jgi:DNA repair protein RadD
MDAREGLSGAGNMTVRVDFVTPYRSFSVWFVPESKGWKQRDEWAKFHAATKALSETPRTVTYRKEESGFYRLIDLNREEDHEPEEPEYPGFWRQDVSRQVSA